MPAVWTPAQVLALRRRLGYTQVEMAGALDYLNAGSVSHLERGVKRPSGPLRRLLGFLDCDGGRALTGGDPKEWSPDRIRVLRVRLGLSQAGLADVLGYETERSVGALERGVSRPVGAARRLLGLLDAGDLRPS